MDDATIMFSLFIGALVLLIIIFIIFKTSQLHHTNETAKIITTTIASTKAEVAKLGIESNERIEGLKSQNQLAFKQFDAQINADNNSTAKIIEQTKLEGITTICSTKLATTQLHCNTAKELQDKTNEANHQVLKSNEAQLKSILDSKEKIHQTQMSLEGKRIQLHEKQHMLEAETSKSIAKLAFETQTSINKAETERFIRGCDTGERMNTEQCKIAHEGNQLKAKLGQAQIRSTESCFRQQLRLKERLEKEKTERLQIQKSGEIIKDLSGVATAGFGLAVGGGSGAAIAGIGSQILGRRNNGQNDLLHSNHARLGDGNYLMNGGFSILDRNPILTSNPILCGTSRNIGNREIGAIAVGLDSENNVSTTRIEEVTE